MRKIIFICILAFGVLTGCGSNYTSADYNSENIVDINDVYVDPETTAGKSVDFYMKVFNINEDENSRLVQGYVDPEYKNDDVIVAISNDKEVGKISEGDFLHVQGVNTGKIEGETGFGIDKSWAQINSTSETKVASYLEAVSPTEETLEVNKEIKQNDVTITINKLEQSPIETRLYLSINNESKYKYSNYSFDYTLVVDGNQYEVENNYDAEYEEFVEEVQPGVNVDTMLTFPKIDIKNAKSIKLNIEAGNSANYDIEFTDKSIELK